MRRAEGPWSGPQGAQTHSNLGALARLIQECLRDPFQGVGKPEPLKHEIAGYWSRRITNEHRLEYRATEGRCIVVQCRYHY